MINLVLIIVIILIILLVGAVVRTIDKRKPKTIDDIIDIHTDALSKAQEALQKSETHLARLQSQVNLSNNDIRVLNARIKEAVAEGKDDEARNEIRRLKLEEQALSERVKNLEQAQQNHQWYADSVEKERKAIYDARQAAEALTTKLELAQATQTYQKSTFGLDEARQQLESKVRIAESQVQATEVGKKDEFLAAAEETDVENTLAEFKAQVKN